MKLATPEEIEAHSAASTRGAIEGGLASSLAAASVSYWLQKTNSAYRRLPFPIKTLGVVLVVAPCISIQAERRGYEYDQSTWTGEHRWLLEEKNSAEKARWKSLTIKEKCGKFVERHQYSLILGGWAAGLAIAGVIIHRNKYQTMGQKVVQARMWAQGLTIGLLIAAGALTHSQRRDARAHPRVDHSWQELLDHQEHTRTEDKYQQNALPTINRSAEL